MPASPKVFLVLALLTLLAACGSPGPGNNPDPDPLPTLQTCPSTIVIENMAFQTPACEVDIGTTITFINKDLQPHNATSDTAGAVAAFATDTLERNQSAQVTFSEAGDYPYYCSIHTDMQGRIIAK